MTNTATSTITRTIHPWAALITATPASSISGLCSRILISTLGAGSICVPDFAAFSVSLFTVPPVPSLTPSGSDVRLLPPKHLKDFEARLMRKFLHDFGVRLRIYLGRGKVGGFKEDHNLD